MHIVTLALNLLVAAPPTCEVGGTIHYLSSAKVAVPHGRSFDATLGDVAAHASFGPRGRVTLTLDGPLVAAATPERIEVHLKAPHAIAGLVTIGPKMALRVDDVRADAVQVTAIDYDGLELGPFPVRCDMLELGATLGIDNARVAAAAGTAKVYPKRVSGVLRSEPNGGAKLAFKSDEAAFDQGETNGKWTRVTATWADGSALGAWLQGATTTAPKASAPELGTRDLAACNISGVPKGSGYYGPATLKSGAEIVDDPSRPHAWARTTGPIEVTVRGDHGMVEVMTLPGLTSCALAAFVRAEDVTFPK